MSIATISSIGKQEKSNSRLYINIVNIPNQSTPTGIPTRLEFLSSTEVKNYSDLLTVLDIYGDYSQPVILVGGEYVNGNNRYAVIDMYIYQSQTLYLSYKNSLTGSTSVQLATIQTPPSDWTYVNIPV